MKKLIIIDMQNDFITGSLGSLDAQAIVPNVVARANEYEPEEIMFTADRHNDDYLNTLEGKKLPVKHCIMGTDGYKIIAPLEGFIQPHSREVFPYQYWIDGIDKGCRAIDMPFKYKVEMICDFMGAGRAYSGKAFTYEGERQWWIKKKANCPDMLVHPLTIKFIDEFMDDIAVNGDEAFKRLRR